MKRVGKILLVAIILGTGIFAFVTYQKYQQVLGEATELQYQNDSLNLQLQKYQGIFVDSLGRIGADLHALSDLPLQLQGQTTHFQHFFYVHDLNRDGQRDTFIVEKDDKNGRVLVLYAGLSDTLLLGKFPHIQTSIRDTLFVHRAGSNLSRTDIQLMVIPHQTEDHLAVIVTDFGKFNYLNLIRPFNRRFISAFDLAYTEGLEIKGDTLALRWRKNGTTGNERMETRYVWLEAKKAYQYIEKSEL